MDEKALLVELCVKWLVVAKGNVGNRHVIKFIRHVRLFKSLVADVGIGIKRLGDLRRQRIKLNAGDDGLRLHGLRHEADEMADAASWLQNASLFESQSLQCRIHSLDDFAGSVMGVERGSAGKPEFLLGNQFGKFPAFGLPVGRRIENLRQSAPADITHQRGFFLLGGRSVFGLKFANQFYRGEIGAALFLGRACADAIGGGNPVIVLIADYSLVASGGNRMYSSRTISQARSCACCAVKPCF